MTGVPQDQPGLGLGIEIVLRLGGSRVGSGYGHDLLMSIMDCVEIPGRFRSLF
jgi:hypothetical protein